MNDYQIGCEEKWQEIDHPSDICVLAEGDSMKELFRNAANAMLSLVFGGSEIQNYSTHAIKADGLSPEDLLIDWLEEILFFCESKSFAALHTEILHFEKNRLTGKIAGEKYTPPRHSIRYDIKAVTWHNIKIQRGKGTYKTRIIFDI